MIARSCSGSLALLAAIGIAGAAKANPPGDACSVTVQQLGETHVSPYNALQGGEYSEPIRLRLWNKGDQVCTGTMTIRNDFGSAALKRAGGGEMTYSIADEHDRSATIFDPGTNTAEPVPVSIPAGKSIEIQPRFVVPGGQQGRAGHYAAILEAHFRQDGQVTDELGDISLAVDVMPSAEANFVGYGREATLDLGELKPGVSGSIGLQIRASADVDVEVSSDSRGDLLHTGGGAIPYTMTVDGQAVDLSSADRRHLDLANSVRGKTVPVAVLVGAFERAPVGQYSDVVTFRISAR
jgi:hypothetical protein